MKITLIPAAKRRKIADRRETEQEDTLCGIVETFINGPLKSAIMSAEENAVNVEIPGSAYEHGDNFYKMCKDILETLGYEAEKSHDGGGMYSTLCVSWDRKK